MSAEEVTEVSCQGSLTLYRLKEQDPNEWENAKAWYDLSIRVYLTKLLRNKNGSKYSLQFVREVVSHLVDQIWKIAKVRVPELSWADNKGSSQGLEMVKTICDDTFWNWLCTYRLAQDDSIALNIVANHFEPEIKTSIRKYLLRHPRDWFDLTDELLDDVAEGILASCIDDVVKCLSSAENHTLQELERKVQKRACLAAQDYLAGEKQSRHHEVELFEETLPADDPNPLESDYITKNEYYEAMDIVIRVIEHCRKPLHQRILTYYWLRNKTVEEIAQIEHIGKWGIYQLIHRKNAEAKNLGGKWLDANV